MPRVISIHHYDLRGEIASDTFLQGVAQAEEQDLFQLPGMVGYHFLRGIKGNNLNSFASIWVYESREAWETLWGTIERPIKPEEYPQKWLQWEAILEPMLNTSPDEIRYTTYTTLETGS